MMQGNAVTGLAEFVLPYHKRLIDTFAGDGPVGVHMCGDASHIYPLLVDELGLTALIPVSVDHRKLREQLGPDVEIWEVPALCC